RFNGPRFNGSTLSCAALVLAGGQSRRMGRDKALLCHHGMPLLRYLVEVAHRCCDPVAVVTPWVDRYRSILPPECGLIPETPAPWAAAQASSGPLWGFHHGLSGLAMLPEAADRAMGNPLEVPPWVLLLACDLPRLTPAILHRWMLQLSALPPQTLALLPPNPKGWDPLCGFYHRDCGPLLDEFLRGADGGGEKSEGSGVGGRSGLPKGSGRSVSFQSWLRQPTIAPRIAPLTVVDRSVLLNCNTPADWQGV
ncbi:MAG: NTP transferase domain-containing protein, partial [Prochlorothrix sp.]